MSTGKRIPLDEAQAIANEIVNTLEPHCERIAIAGSIRRQSETVGDIELVCIPKQESQAGLFGSQYCLSPSFIKAVMSLGARSKGSSDGKYVQMKVMPPGIPIEIFETARANAEEPAINLDLFMTTPKKWGWIYLLRTGSAEFSARVARALKRKSFDLSAGHIWKRGSRLPVYTEADVFGLAGMNWVEPDRRV